MLLQDYIDDQDKIKNLVPTMGYSMVSAKITNEGLPVGYMYRERPGEEEDSGWRFMSGSETEEYLDVEEHVKLVDVNIIANLDPAIIPYLNAKPGTELERNTDNNTFEVM